MITPKIHRRVRTVLKQGATLAYWNSDAQGRPANHKPEHPEDWTAYPGAIQTVKGPLQVCGPNALHATLTPHKWAGSRVWLVALWGEVQEQENKFGALKREILCEIFPEDAIDQSVAVRIGVKHLPGADLDGANLGGADLDGAYLGGANLRSANLGGADLDGAYLGGANLRSANLGGANLGGANLGGANLGGADLGGAYLGGANLGGADLGGAFNLTLPDGWQIVNGYGARK